jgi:hypothetical protein
MRTGMLAVSLLTMLAGSAFAADAWREVKGRDVAEKEDASAAPGDKPGIWTLHFKYKPPRIVTVDLGAKGKKPVWYMPFEIYNRNENPLVITPVFELVTKDLNTVHKDEPQPEIFAAIAKLEDPEGVMKPKSTINISKDKIPVTKRDSFPRVVAGLAIWADVPERAARTNRFSVYISGLSDGLVVDKLQDGGLLVKVKTLQLDFFKPTDDINPKPGDIKIEENGGLGGERWIYRAASKRKPEADAAVSPPAENK